MWPKIKNSLHKPSAPTSYLSENIYKLGSTKNSQAGKIQFVRHGENKAKGGFSNNRVHIHNLIIKQDLQSSKLCFCTPWSIVIGPGAVWELVLAIGSNNVCI